jgi:hypothetical protein
MVSKVPVLYYSSFGHIEAMANAVAEGARRPVRILTSSAIPNSARGDRSHVALQVRSGDTDSQPMPSAEDRFFVVPARSQG